MKERFWLKPVAILLGIFAWLYVNIFSATPIVREYKVKIAYLNTDNSRKFKVIPEHPELKVRVRGPRGVFIQTKVEENTYASVDLINTHGGKFTLPVNVILPSNSNLELVSKEPAQLVINAIKMVTKDIDVRVNIVGSVPEGYLSDIPSISPAKLAVTAPEESIDSIKDCAIDLYLDDIKRSISEFRQTHIVYKDGRIESNMKAALIEIANNNVKLDIAVREGFPEKKLSVRPSLLNKAPEGRKLDSYITLPEVVTITGPSRIIDKIDFLNLEPVDLASIPKSTTVQVKVLLPAGVQMVGLPTVALTLKYSDVVINKTISELPLEITSDAEQLVDCEVTSYSILLEGLIDDITAIKKGELKNILYVKGLASGSYNIGIEAPYGLSERLKVKSIFPDSVTVVINTLEKVEAKDEGETLHGEPAKRALPTDVVAETNEALTASGTLQRPSSVLPSVHSGQSFEAASNSTEIAASAPPILPESE